MAPRIFSLLCVALALAGRPAFTAPWVRTGGPIGGLGYNIKIHPTNKNILFVTDAWSGVNRSTDGGLHWQPGNSGITARSGPSGDAIPVFSLAVDSHDPNIVWAGTQGIRGIFKSTDGGVTFVERDSGIFENLGLTIRNFEVHPWSSDTVFASGELATGIQGVEFERVKGVVYKTANGGVSWTKIWEDSSLARWLCLGPNNPQNMILSTGIFDREALNVKGKGFLKSADGGQTWVPANLGLASLFVGGMADNPPQSAALLIGTGNNAENSPGSPVFGGVYLSSNGGNTWKRVIGPRDSLSPGSPDNVFTATALSKSNNKVMYAANAAAFYRSADSGVTWTRLAGPNGAPYGPPGVRAGVPIEITVDPDNEDVLLVNNYGGGVFKSVDGAKTWSVLGTGYTGADIHAVSVKAGAGLNVLVVGRSGPFQSLDGGANWSGQAFDAAGGFAEWYGAAQQPGGGSALLLSDEHAGVILRNAGGAGAKWAETFRHPAANPALPSGRHGAKAFAFSPLNPQIVYAGFAADGFYSTPDDTSFAPSFGVYKSTDGGLTWTEKNSGLGATKKNILCLAVSPADSSLVYAGTRGDGIFKSADGGQTWTDLTADLPSRSVTAVGFSPGNPRVAYAGTLDAGVFKTMNGGVSWIPRLSKTLPDSARVKLIMALAVDFKSEDIVYAGDWRSGVYRTVDGGQNWTLLDSGLSTRAVNALSLSSDGSLLYAGTKGEGVFRLQTNTGTGVLPSPAGSGPRLAVRFEAPGRAVLDYVLDAGSAATLEVWNGSGKRTVSIHLGWRPAGSHSQVLEAESWPRGLYFIRLRGGFSPACARLLRL